PDLEGQRTRSTRRLDRTTGRRRAAAAAGNERCPFGHTAPPAAGGPSIALRRRSLPPVAAWHPPAGPTSTAPSPVSAAPESAGRGAAGEPAVASAATRSGSARHGEGRAPLPLASARARPSSRPGLPGNNQSIAAAGGR